MAKQVKPVLPATSHGVGNPVYIVGSATGKDGISWSHASADITEELTTTKRPPARYKWVITSRKIIIGNNIGSDKTVLC